MLASSRKTKDKELPLAAYPPYPGTFGGGPGLLPADSSIAAPDFGASSASSSAAVEGLTVATGDSADPVLASAKRAALGCGGPAGARVATGVW